MNKTILLIVLTTLSLLLVSCADYSDYKNVKIPDDNIGNVKIPKHWGFEVIDGWIQIVDIEKDEIIGVQWLKGLYYYVGTDLHDERSFNPYFNEYERTESDLMSGNSNGAQWGYHTWEISSVTYKYRFLLFIGSEDSSYEIQIILFDDTIEDNVLSNIAKSYKK